MGVDTGGTFTDFALLEDGEIRFEKVPSTPAAPELALLDGLARLGCERTARDGPTIVHGTTVALNALLTGRHARTALVTNAGFRDLLEIGRQDRPDLYALEPLKPTPIVPRKLRFELAQRSWPDPRDPARTLEVRKPSRADLRRLVAQVRRARPESLAICLLHSYADPAIEREVARALRGLGLPITCSSELLREHREYERFSTAAVNAALVPVVAGYLARLCAAVPRERLELMQSSGGTLPADRAALEPVRVLLSGPAGGVVGAARAARTAGFERMVGLDMGGTSTDVAFQSLARARATQRAGPIVIAGLAVATPSLDIHTIGCGGGSLIHVDRGGALQVGPKSAGADPGPVCYGVGDALSITDAHVLLGRVATGAFLGGRLQLDVAAVERAFEKLGRKLGIEARAAALASLDVANAAMRRALAFMTMQRGEDPRSIPLVAFGGAGGLHACDLAAALAMPCALVPFGPGVLSALGMATADASRDASRSVLASLAQIPAKELRRMFDELSRSACSQFVETGHDAREIEIEAALDLRYAGQSFELRVPFQKHPARAFHARHAELYGYSDPSREIELVDLRVRAVVRRMPPKPERARVPAQRRAVPIAQRRATFATRSGRAIERSIPVFDRALLTRGAELEGPCLIDEFSATTVVPPRWRARVVGGRHLLLERSR